MSIAKLGIMVCGAWILWGIVFFSCLIPGIILLDQAEDCYETESCDEDSVEYERNTGTVLILVGGIPALIYGVLLCCFTITVVWNILCSFAEP